MEVGAMVLVLAGLMAVMGGVLWLAARPRAALPVRIGVQPRRRR